ncbi:MAG: PEP-CTERM sorting domain-containing protein [Thermoguttaceae bacterium]|jgi:hypothetical protein|nr:PEP-CTERM sorting domain-containing protein [Thermoguttaceae bacterium]
MRDIRVAGILLLVGVISSTKGTDLCLAEMIETFDTAVDPFPGAVYDNWSFVQSNGAARVVVTGENGVLEMRRTTTEYPPVTYAWATQTSLDLFGTSTFIDRYPDGFSVAVDIGGTGGASNALHGISIGNIAALPYLGYNGFRWRNLSSDAYVGSLLALGWTPSYATTTPHQQMVMHVEPDGVNYKLSVTLTEGSHLFSTTRTFTPAELGTLDKVGLYFRSAHTAGGAGLYDNFSVVPEPSALLLLAAGLLTAMVARRRGNR